MKTTSSEFLKNISDFDDSEETLKKILQVVPDSMIMVNQQGKIFFVSEQAKKLFGYQGDELLGEYVEVLMPESYRARHAEHVRSYFINPVTRPMGAGLNLFVERKDKEIIPVEISLSPVKIKEKIIALAAIRDITERKKIEKQMIELHQQVSSAAKRAGMAEVSNTILHNLGNILNSINVSAGLLQETSTQSDVIKKFKKVVDLISDKKSTINECLNKDSKGKILIEYLQGLLELSENEYKKFTNEINGIKKQLNFSIEVVNRQQLMSGNSIFLENTLVGENLAYAIKLSGLDLSKIKVTNDINPVLLINTDKNKLLQIFINLIIHANESLLLNNSVNKNIAISAKENINNTISIIFQDNGVGIAPERLGHIFSFGSRANEEGLCFGLHNSFLLAKELGGSLGVQSEGVGKGSVFTLTLNTSKSVG